MKIMTFIKAGKNITLFRRMAYIIFSGDIGPNAKIDKSTKFCHNGLGVVIGGSTVIEKGCTIYPFTLFGYKNGFPHIGENCIVYPHSVIVGNITIGKNCVIGANSFVDKDIPDNSVVYPKTKLHVAQRKF